MGSTTNDVYKDSWELYKYHGEQFNDDIDYYKDFCLGFDTLELFAGYGRLTNPLSAMGIAIETVELSRRFSEFIQLPPHKVHVMDVLDFQPSRQFDRVIARRYAKIDRQNPDTTWAYYAHSLTRALVMMNGSIEFKGFVCDVHIERVACARMAKHFLTQQATCPRPPRYLKKLPN